MSVQELSCQEQTYLTSAKTVNAFSIASIMNNNCAEEPDRALTRESGEFLTVLIGLFI